MPCVCGIAIASVDYSDEGDAVAAGADQASEEIDLNLCDKGMLTCCRQIIWPRRAPRDVLMCTES